MDEKKGIRRNMKGEPKKTIWFIKSVYLFFTPSLFLCHHQGYFVLAKIIPLHYIFTDTVVIKIIITITVIVSPFILFQ